MREKLKQAKQITWHIRDKMLTLFYHKCSTLNLRQSWKTQCVCVYITCSTPDAAYKGKDDSAICCASLCYILMSNKACITCQSLVHTAGIESKLMEGLAPALQVLHATWQSKDNAGTNQWFSGAQKYVQKDSKPRLKTNSHPNHIPTLCVISSCIHTEWLMESNLKIIFSSQISVKLGAVFPIFLRQLTNLANFHETDVTVLLLLQFSFAKMHTHQS